MTKAEELDWIYRLRSNIYVYMPKEWLGMAAVLYEVKEDGTLGDFIGYYEFCDTGAGMDTDGDGNGDTIRTGNSVDVWQPNMESARSWIKEHGDYVYMQIVPAVG